MLSIGNKTFMNLQEAVGWLLENNALPFQSTANYAGGVEIAMSTLINPSPAKVRVGSIIFFADSKVSTVVGVTSNSFIVSDQYNDLVDDVVYVSNVALNASGHLIVTLSNGNTIDAGLIKQVSSFSIDGSQHLIANYNDSTSTDLGAIFSGNISISGDLSVSGTISQALDNAYDLNLVCGLTGVNLTNIYSKLIIKNHILYIIVNFKLENTTAAEVVSQNIASCNVTLPAEIASKIYDLDGNSGEGTTLACGVCATLACESDNKNLTGITSQQIALSMNKQTSARTYGVAIRTNTGYHIPANAERYLTGRMLLTI